MTVSTEFESEGDDNILPLVQNKPEEPPILRDLIESFAFAIIMALVIKNFLAEAYKVPTGSMEPTIHGAQENGDRILVNKLVNLIRDPLRWEIWVFKYPNNRQVNYVKRIVGVGPESISIIDGDIYTAPFGTTEQSLRLLLEERRLRIETKPRSVQEAIFARYPRILPDKTAWDSLEAFRDDWIVSRSNLPGATEWNFDGGIVGVCGGRSMVHFRHEIKDQRDPFQDVGTTNHYGEFEVGDLRLDFVCNPRQKEGMILCEIRDPQLDEFVRAEIPIEGGSNTGGVYIGKRRMLSLDKGLVPVGKESRIRFTNVDNQIELEINGTRYASISYDHIPRMLSGQAKWPAGVGLGVAGANVHFVNAQIYRDIYYRGGGGGLRRSIFEPSYPSWRSDIPEGHYYVLGDNSPASNDSREWHRKTIKFMDSEIELEGDTMAVVDPEVLEDRLDNPYTLSETLKNGETGSERYFVDDFGNKHKLSKYGSIKGIDETPSPLVPRHLFIGRAYAVFLPLNRMKLVR
ncbi:MAG: signal peptidase I [Planctomycetota bacterium]|jgi:signal peptidase I